MIRIIHGENTVKSREKLHELASDYVESGSTVVRIDGKQLDEKLLEEYLGSQELFITQKAFIIEELHSLPVSKKRTALIQKITEEQTHDVVIWEKKTLTAKMISAFPRPEVFEYKTSKILFTWLETLGLKTNPAQKLTYLHQAIAADSDHFCFIMLCWYVRLLIQAKTDEVSTAPPFMKSKLKKQAQFFSLEKLLSFHAELLAYDQGQKTSRALLKPTQQLDLWTVTM